MVHWLKLSHGGNEFVRWQYAQGNIQNKWKHLRKWIVALGTCRKYVTLIFLHKNRSTWVVSPCEK